MVAFIQPPENSNQPVDFQYAHQVLAEVLPSESVQVRSRPSMVEWKIWLLVVWMLIAAVWGVSLVIGTLL
jgi:hypothetical protein